MTSEQLLVLLRRTEDNFVERKTTHQRDSVTNTLVAFANSVPVDREVVLFIGVQNDGRVVGVGNAENVQKDVQSVPISFVREGNKSVKASARVYAESIASRNEKAGAILRHKDQSVTVVLQVPPPAPPSPL